MSLFVVLAGHDTDVITVNGWLDEDAAGALADKNGRIKKLELQERSLTGEAFLLECVRLHCVDNARVSFSCMK